jgi:hypothetical protein
MKLGACSIMEAFPPLIRDLRHIITMLINFTDGNIMQ